MRPGWWKAVRIVAVYAGLVGLSCNPSGVFQPGDPTDDPVGQPAPVDPSNPDGTDQPPDNPLPADPTSSANYRARVRNESAARADVTLRFIRDDSIVHLAFVRVLPKTVTTVASLESATVVEVSGIDDAGRALESKSLTFVTVEPIQAVEYVIPEAPTPGTPDPVDEPDPEFDPPTISLLEPATNATVELGAMLKARWTDEGGGPGTVVRIRLRPVGGSPATGIEMGPAIGASLDGINDELSVVLEGLSPGDYEVVAEISDSDRTAFSIAPGRISAVRRPGNAAPTLTITSPSSVVDRRAGDALLVEWQDEDLDDNATVTFALESSLSGELSQGVFGISPPLAEDPDGATSDRATLLVSGLPGLYDLVGTIDDGELAGTFRVVGAVRILPAPGNDSPTLQLLSPAAETNVEIGRSVSVRWVDSDADNDARISLLLDPDDSALDLNGNEILLVTSLGEDVDGAGDQILLGIPETVPSGVYSVVGLITDGVTQVVTRAPGLIYVTEPEPSGGNDPDPTQLRRIAILEPSVAQFSRLGSAVPVRVQLTNLPANTALRVFITGTHEDGDHLRVDVTPPDFSGNRVVQLNLPTDTVAIPNKWWPREFRLEAEATFNGVRYQAKAAGAIWIRQEVEVRSVRMINYWCHDEDLALHTETPFFGLEIDWFGGGFGDGDPPGFSAVAGQVPAEDALIQFWLANDGVLAADLSEDFTHRRIVSIEPSPNKVRTTRVPYVDLIGIAAEDLNQPPSQLQPALADGDYALLTATETDLFGRIITNPGENLVEVCFPLPVSP